MKNDSKKDRPKTESESFFVAKLNDGTKTVVATRPSKNLIVLKHCGVQSLAIENDEQPKNYAFLK